MYIVCIKLENCFSEYDLLKEKTNNYTVYSIYYIIMYIVVITRKLFFRR